MTKQTKILVFIVLCCTFLFALGITSFGADEPSEGNQIIIPSGTYTWVDNPSLPTGYYDFDINFTCNGTVVYDEITETFYFDPTQTTNGYSIGSDTSTNSLNGLIFYGWDSGLIGWVWSGDFGWDTQYMLLTDALVDDPRLKDFGRTITVLEDTSVDITLGEWFLNSTTTSVDPPYEGNPFVDIMNLIIEALDIPIFGTFSLWDMLTTLCGLFAVVWLLKLLAGG